MNETTNCDPHADLLERALAGPPATASLSVGEVGGKIAQAGEVARAVVGKMKVAGFGIGEIFAALVLIGQLFEKFGPDIEAIFEAIKAAFGK